MSDHSVRDAGLISFSERLANSSVFANLFREGMDLVEETAAYLDGPGRTDAKALDRSASLAYATESMRLTTRLMHLSGEWVESAMPLPHVGKPQELGSVMTYFRRYQLSAIVGITADDDDDGNEASGNRAQPAQRQPVKQAPSNGNEHDNPFEDESPSTPRSNGGATDISNCTMLCATHNRAKGNK